MYSGIAGCAERDQVLLRVCFRVAAEPPVVHVEIRHRTAGLTPPRVIARVAAPHFLAGSPHAPNFIATYGNGSGAVRMAGKSRKRRLRTFAQLMGFYCVL